MIRWRVAVAALSLGFVGTGCVSISHVQTADTLGQGNFQFAIEPGFAGAAVLSDVADASVTYPHVDLALRYGVTERLDLGVRFGSSLVELQGKYLFTAPGDPDQAISLAPSVMGVFFDVGDSSVSYTTLSLPVLIGFKTSGGSELVLGPRLIGTRIGAGVSSDGASINVLSAGASVGYALRVTEGFRLMPEVGFSYPLVGSVDTTQTDSEVLSGFDGGFMQIKLGFLFGGGRPRRAQAVDEAREEEYGGGDAQPSESSDSAPKSTRTRYSDTDSSEKPPEDLGSKSDGKVNYSDEY